MAHTCPNCGSFCTCNGDWDDIDFGEDLGCEHDCDEYEIPETISEALADDEFMSAMARLSTIIRGK